MEKREFKSKKRYLVAFLIGTFVFLLVFFLSYLLSYFEFQRISNLQIESTYDIFEDKLDYSFFNQGTCSTDSFEKVSQDLRFQGKIIDDLERKLGKKDKTVLSRKKFYTLVELEHLEFINMLNSNCNSNIQTILFFYSNDDEDLEKSEEIGKILNSVFKENSNLIVYSFDLNLDFELIEKLKQKYKIEESPSIIINKENLIFEPKNIEEIEKYLN